MDSSRLQNLSGVWGTSVNRDFGALSLVHHISGIFGESYMWGTHTNKHWGIGAFFFLYPTDDRGRGGPTLTRVGYGPRTHSASLCGNGLQWAFALVGSEICQTRSVGSEG